MDAGDGDHRSLSQIARRQDADRGIEGYLSITGAAIDRCSTKSMEALASECEVGDDRGYTDFRDKSDRRRAAVEAEAQATLRSR